MLMDKLRAAANAGQIELFPFSYSAIFPLATFIVGATLPVNVNINNEADFVIRQSMLTAYSAPGVFVPAPDLTVSLFDTGSGRNWQDQPQHVSNVLGTGQLPFLWPEPVRLTGGSVLTVTMTNLGPAAMLAYVTFSGMKIYLKPGYQR